MSLSKVVDAIRRHKRFLISAHIDPEGDAVGSQLAMASLLKRLGKKAVMIDEDPPPTSCMFLPGIRSITLYKDLKDKRAGKFDCAIIVDCPTLERIGKVKGLIGGDTPVINIDHHVSNDMFGDVNWVDRKAAATGEMIFELSKKLRLRLTRDEAETIYSAILIDTGSFRYSNTSAKTHMIAAELIGEGLDMNAIYEHLFELRSFQATYLLGLVLSGIKKSRDGKIVWVWLTKRMLKESGASFDEAENFIGMPRSVKGCKAALFFRETDKKGVYKVSFRGSKEIDVNKIASKFGGGGHARASGCTIKAANPKQAEKTVLKEVAKAV
jgi:phosphoesterase RecJ-like protein